tara:strand:- start:344 stop:553 length:210 start_codon:yes stop_codon:yes gene_type:complete
MYGVCYKIPYITERITMYLIIQETKFANVDSVYSVCNFTNDLDKANDMLKGYNLINKKDDVVYTLVKYK